MKFVFYPDAPPIQHGGHANHSIAWSWSQAMAKHTALVITRRFQRKINLHSIEETIGVPIAFYPDFSLFGLRRISDLLRYCLDTLLFMTCLPRLLGAIRRRGANRIFAFPSGSCVCLFNAWLLGRLSGLPVDVYLVDDLEALAVMNQQHFIARVTRWTETKLLPRFAKVYTLSKGHAEHLQAKYGIQPEWLPLVIRAEEIAYAPPPASGETRSIGFCGSTNPLYREALHELSEVVAHLNKTTPHRYRISLFTVGRPADFETIFPDPSIVDLFYGLPNEQIVARLRQSYANFLPYSFSESLKVMVSTAFSCKTAEYFAAGRPILVYGPAYASVPRHFLEHGLPLVCTERGKLEALISEVERFDNPALAASYSDLVSAYHSPAALRQRLAPDTDADSATPPVPLSGAL